MATVRKLLEGKLDTKVHTLEATQTVLEALKLMNETNTGAVLITEGEKIVGIFTERDYARQGEVKGRCAKDTLIGDVMTRQMVMVKPDTTLQEAVEVLRKYRVRHLPVLDGERIVGIVSIRGLAEGLLEEHKGTIVELENYILGTGYVDKI